MTVVELLFFLRHRSQRENERARCLEGMLGNASSPTPNKSCSDDLWRAAAISDADVTSYVFREGGALLWALFILC